MCSETHSWWCTPELYSTWDSSESWRGIFILCAGLHFSLYTLHIISVSQYAVIRKVSNSILTKLPPVAYATKMNSLDSVAMAMTSHWLPRHISGCHAGCHQLPCTMYHLSFEVTQICIVWGTALENDILMLTPIQIRFGAPFRMMHFITMSW